MRVTEVYKDGKTIKVKTEGYGETGTLDCGNDEECVSGGLSAAAVNLLVEILESAVYTDNVSGKIASLKESIAVGGGNDGGSSDDSSGDDVVADDITVADGIMTIITVGSAVSVVDGVMTIA